MKTLFWNIRCSYYYNQRLLLALVNALNLAVIGLLLTLLFALFVYRYRPLKRCHMTPEHWMSGLSDQCTVSREPHPVAKVRHCQSLH